MGGDEEVVSTSKLIYWVDNDFVVIPQETVSPPPSALIDVQKAANEAERREVGGA